MLRGEQPEGNKCKVTRRIFQQKNVSSDSPGCGGSEDGPLGQWLLSLGADLEACPHQVSPASVSQSKAQQTLAPEDKARNQTCFEK